MKNEHTPIGWNFWIWWVLGSTMGFVLGLAAAWIPVTWILFFTDSMAYGGLLGWLPGGLMGILQWEVLRRIALRAV